jgi:hypothetical protein
MINVAFTIDQLSINGTLIRVIRRLLAAVDRFFDQMAGVNVMVGNAVPEVYARISHFVASVSTNRLLQVDQEN